MRDGGYDKGYQRCWCFWGTEPASLLTQLTDIVPTFTDLRALDVGCGEGKNTAYLLSKGCLVRSLDISSYALTNACRHWREIPAEQWEISDVRQVTLEPESFDIVLAYGLLHCLDSAAEVKTIVRKLQMATSRLGYNLICAFNDRSQDLTAHPDLTPCLLPHSQYLDLYRDWDLIYQSDSDLWEEHPHNRIRHCHSMTRIIARKTK